MARVKPAPIIAEMRGKFGTASFGKAKGGYVNMRPRVTPTNPRTTAQVGVRGAHTKASQLFKNATSAQLAAWKSYAASLPQVSKKTGAKITVQPINAFCALADKFLQVSPTGTVPMTPPTSAFVGDAITVTATGGTGQVLFTATGANTTGVRTEVLLQPLKSKNRTPQPKGYRTKAFVSYLATAPNFAVTVPPGHYAAAYRFVSTATGQETALIPIPVVTVALSMEDGGMADEPAATKKKAA